MNVKRIAISIGGGLLSWALALGATPDDLGFPFEGEVKAANVNVRAGPGTNFTSLAVAKKGERLTVLAKQGDWYKIQLPAGCRLWVSARYVGWTEGQPTGEVTGDKVSLRAEGRPDAEMVAQLSKGDRLRVIRKTGDWLEVEPTSDAAAFIFAKHVDGVGPAEQDSQEWFEIRKAYDAEMRKPLAQRSLGAVVTRTEKLMSECDNPRVKERATPFLKQVREQREWTEKVSSTLEERERKIRDIERQWLADIRKVVHDTPWTDRPLVSGWLFECGNLVGGSPGSHKLLKGGKLVAYVRGDSVNLTKYYGKLVGLNGEETFDVRFPEPVIVIHAESQIQVIGTGSEE